MGALGMARGAAAIDGIRSSAGKHRRALNLKVAALPEVSMLGFDIFTHVGGLGKHEHPGQFEICLIIRGHVTWWARERQCELRGGDVYVTWPDEPHGGLHELMHPCTIYWMTVGIPQPDEPAAKKFLHLPPVEAKALCAGAHGLRDRHLRGAERLQPFYEAMFTHLEARTLSGVTRARAALQCMLATMAELPVTGQPGGFVPPGISRAREFLDGCPRPWAEVAELASLAGMSVSHFHASFLKQVGTAPMEYSHRARLDKARTLLREPGATVTEVALRLGYCSSQHLAACFKRYLGQTPSQARKG
jgi:AraC-like DNA-binding protein